MRDQPTWRIPFGILLLFAGLTVYGLVISRYLPNLIGDWPTLAQVAVYLVLGVVWILPLKRYLVWMETGHWRS